MQQPQTPIRAVALISGSGSNLQAIIDAIQNDGLPVELCAVISNRADAYGLERAQQAGIHTETLDHKQFDGRESFDTALQALIDRFDPQLVILAGFMRILTPGFVHHYQGRMLNIHPSLLPKFTGLNTHRRAIEAGESEHGASIHFVTEELDGGPVFLQGIVPIEANDTPEQLAARVLEQEHRIYSLAVRWFAEGRIQLQGDQAVLDGHPLNGPCLLTSDQDSPTIPS